jgi:hypothetical protein
MTENTPKPAPAPWSATAPVGLAKSERERRDQLDLAHTAADHLSRLNGALELRAAVLALLLPAHSKRALRAWEAETEGTSNAIRLREEVARLGGPARLTWLQTLVTRMRSQSLDSRQTLLEATRRVMSARGTVHPLDRLHWLAMRQWLGEGSAASTRAPAVADLTQLPQAEVSAIASYSAFLSRLVPLDALDVARGASANTAPGVAWYDTVTMQWQAHATVEACRPPDTDGLVHALQTLQGLAWMQRPTLVRDWVSAAQQHSRHGRLVDVAADALRLSCVLLDSPMPPDLARHYGASP